MNKYQKALDNLVHYLVPFHATATKENAKMINDCLNTFKELVDKETPTKVTEIYTDSYYCPNCGNEVLRFKYHNEYTHKYCLNCGQHLDWGEE